jgi:hypothetical protein
MSTSYPDVFAALAAPFASNEVKVRQQAGRQLHYVTARTVMNRLDSILGPENWSDEYRPFEHSVLCILTIRLPDGTLLTKQDAGGYAGMSDHGDDDKSGYSDAFKRAAVKFGVGRYLYRDGVPDYNADEPGVIPAPAAREPRSPAVKPPETAPERFAPPPRQPGPTNANGNPRNYGLPKSGAALFAWAKNLEADFQVATVKTIDEQFVRGMGWPRQYKDWDAAQVELGMLYLCTKLREHPHYDGQFDAVVPPPDELRGQLYNAVTEILKLQGIAGPGYPEHIEAIYRLSSELPGELSGGEVIDDLDRAPYWLVLLTRRAALAQLAETDAVSGGRDSDSPF